MKHAMSRPTKERSGVKPPWSVIWRLVVLLEGAMEKLHTEFVKNKL
jgi:hypothetical protein